MFNTISNVGRKADKYGDIHFISFLGAILSRLAYMDDNKFLNSYNKIMGPVIQPKILEGINSVNPNNLEDLLNDQKIFGLNKDSNDIFSNYEYQYKGQNFIDFINLNMPQNVNIINGDLTGQLNFPVEGTPPPPDTVKYISIGWSNYGEIYIVADKRMPNLIFVIFRGTYSAKTAALYTKPTSIIPLTVCKDTQGNPEQFLYGIFKASSEMIHTIIESIRYLATEFLMAKEPNSVKIFTTGHSLGGAMCTNFSYLWMGIKKTSPYNTSPYNVLADNIVCVSLGAPRCMGSSVAKKFCNFAMQKKILYLRITSKGDPVPALPPKTGFQHPCSDDNNMRMVISEDCNANLNMRPTPNINYSSNLDCLNYKARAYVPNVFSHTVYLDILYTKAVNIGNFLKGIGTAQEVSRDTDKSTVCRVILGTDNDFKATFFNVNKSREKPTNIDAIEESELAGPNTVNVDQLSTTGGGWFPSTNKSTSPTTTTTTSNSGKSSWFPSTNKSTSPTTTTTSTTTPNSGNTSWLSSTKKSIMASKPNIKIGGEVAEDSRMTMQAFNSLVQQMVPLQGNLCPQKGTIIDPFNNQLMPDLSCPATKIGGKRNNRKTKKRRKTKRRRKTFSRKH
jgi:hypothetical protein